MRTRLTVLALLLAGVAGAQKFYPDDPLAHEPPPLDASGVSARSQSKAFDVVENTLFRAGDHSRSPAGAVNTLGEPMDGPWYTHRHYFKRMTAGELALGAGGKTPPAAGPWTVTKAKAEGVARGFVIADSAGNTYFMKFDPLSNAEMATGADVVTSKFFYAFGYWVPDQYIVHFRRSRLIVGKNATVVDSQTNRTRAMRERDIDNTLATTTKAPDGTYRAIASRRIPGEGMGAFNFRGTRLEDPNDIVLHENRRDLRGMYVFCAWLEHGDSKSNNTYDTLLRDDGTAYLRHYLIDFGSTLGSASVEPKPARAGNEPLFAWTPTLRNMFTGGLYAPLWTRYHYPYYPSVGRFASVTFHPERWVPEYPNPAFDNRLPDDEFWAAKQVMAFTDDDIRTIVHTGQYSDPKAEEYIARILAQRRDKIGRAFIERVLPLDRFAVRNGVLVFDDLGVKYGIVPSRKLTVAWSQFNNMTGVRTPVQSSGFTVPKGAGEYWVADIAQQGDARRTMSVYVRKRGSTVEVVGIDRRW